ncbi:hypothetical protein JR316_0002913 [Psilocybe cubensis]|uniref:Uncharacterized protein n=2 Tax=Psilocybe cubensis TaxID=181762 RepID=A0A8H8CMH2_PSICU|nr:hypothetical protein JR316_0002913 [Psilocybe cubensis]KAH9483445.1 hypothetical protein JR316_0002913 [Psilocybe cubensis]
MAAAPAHYIRTIHSSFSAAHPHSAAWAATSASSQYLNQFNHNHNSPANHNNIISQPPRPHHHHHQSQHGGYTSISTHNTHMYTHHLRDLTHGGAPVVGAGSAHRQQPQLQGGQHAHASYAPNGPRKPSADAQRSGSRRRSVSIRMPPTYKFDPFADEPVSAGAAAPASDSLNDAVSVSEQQQPTHTHTPAAPYTIHIPPAAASDIQMYTPPRPRPRPISTTLSPRAPSFTPAAGAVTPARSTSPTPNPQRSATPTPTPLPRAPPPNLSKVVASILLNRVHAVGKPMRRRMAMHTQGQGRDYVKSCLSSVVSVEA